MSSYFDDENTSRAADFILLNPRPHWGSLQRSRRPLAVFKASDKKRQSGQDKREGKGGEEWRDRGSDGEEREEVDFAPSCKNSCGRP